MFIRINDHEIINIPDDQIESIEARDEHIVIKHHSQSIDNKEIFIKVTKATCNKPSYAIEQISYDLTHASKIIDVI